MDVRTMPEWTDDRVDDLVMGSGAETWPWYQNGIGQVVLGPGKYGDFEVELGIEDFTAARFSRDDFRRVAREVAEGKHAAVRLDVRERILSDDLDEDAVDIVIQILVHGAVVYG